MLSRLLALAFPLLLLSCQWDHRQWRHNPATTPLGASLMMIDGQATEKGVTQQMALNQSLADERKDRMLEIYDNGITLAHVEFSDQGGFWGKENTSPQLDLLEEHVRSHMGDYHNGALIITFTHGWHNNAKEGNGNLANFRNVLAQVKESDPMKRPVIGVYLSWRGNSRPDKVTEYLTTFWHRKEVAERIGYRGMAETMMRLSLLKEEIGRHGEHRSEATMYSRLIAIGHSFGAQALFSSVSRFMEDELVRIAAGNGKPYVDRRWDMIVLVNPAFEAIRYDIINRYRINPERKNYQGDNFYAHLPRMLVVNAENDGPNGGFFPLGQALDARNYATQEHEKSKVRHTLGRYANYYTHRLEPQGDSAILLNGANATRNPLATASPMILFKQNQVAADETSIQAFMVAEASKSLVNGHSGIWDAPFRNFMVKLISVREHAVREFRGQGR